MATLDEEETNLRITISLFQDNIVTVLQQENHSPDSSDNPPKHKKSFQKTWKLF
jgi:hypothetical protein